VVWEKEGDDRPAGGSKARKGRVLVEPLLDGGWECAGEFVLVLIVRGFFEGFDCKGLLIGGIGWMETCDVLKLCCVTGLANCASMLSTGETGDGSLVVIEELFRECVYGT